MRLLTDRTGVIESGPPPVAWAASSACDAEQRRNSEAVEQGDEAAEVPARIERSGIVTEHVRRLREIVGGEELLQVPSVSVALRDAGGRVLLARHSEGGTWLLPGGAIEPGETPADAALREMWEETGLVVLLTRIVGVFGGPRVRRPVSEWRPYVVRHDGIRGRVECESHEDGEDAVRQPLRHAAGPVRCVVDAPPSAWIGMTDWAGIAGQGDSASGRLLVSRIGITK